MQKTTEFSFNDDQVAQSYDHFLVPVLFEPWAQRILEEYRPWNGKYVLDLASGTGVVTGLLVQHVAPEGKITALDMNSQMLALAQQRCAQWSDHIEFIVGNAQAIPVADGSMDMVICQQGFQFFPDKTTAAREIYRVLKKGGKAIISTWCSVDECEFFGLVCETLDEMGEMALSQMMRIPFDLITQEELQNVFVSVGFQQIRISRQEESMMIPGGMERIVDFVFATPIGPKLREMNDQKIQAFRELFAEKIRSFSLDRLSMGKMVTNVLSAEK